MDPNVDRAIRDAVFALLREMDYATLTMEKIAQEAGISKATLYRRWKSKAEVVLEIFFSGTPNLPIPESTDFQETLRRAILEMVCEFQHPLARKILPGLVADYSGRADYKSKVVQDVMEPGYKMLRAVLSRFPEAAHHFDSALLMDMLFSLIFMRCVILDKPITETDINSLLAMVVVDRQIA